MTKQITTTKRPKKGIEIVAAFRASGKTRADFCRQTGINISTLDYYNHRARAEERARLVPVEVVGDNGASATTSARTVAVWLRNGRRVEMSWHGDESSMGRMLGLLERE